MYVLYLTQALIVVLSTRARMSPHVFKMNVGRMKGEAPKQIPLDPFFGTSLYLFLCIINKGPKQRTIHSMILRTLYRRLYQSLCELSPKSFKLALIVEFGTNLKFIY